MSINWKLGSLFSKEVHKQRQGLIFFLLKKLQLVEDKKTFGRATGEQVWPRRCLRFETVLLIRW